MALLNASQLNDIRKLYIRCKNIFDESPDELNGEDITKILLAGLELIGHADSQKEIINKHIISDVIAATEKLGVSISGLKKDVNRKKRKAVSTEDISTRSKRARLDISNLKRRASESAEDETPRLKRVKIDTNKLKRRASESAEDETLGLKRAKIDTNKLKRRVSDQTEEEYPDPKRARKY